MKYNYKIDYTGLKNYLKSLKSFEIENELLKIEEENVNAEKLPFLTSVIDNDLSIVMPTKMEYEMPNKRLMHAKFVSTMVDECHGVKGYFKIPKEFITERNN